MWNRMTAATSAVLLLAGCASLPEDRGRGGADALAAERNLPVARQERADEITAEMLSGPLGPGEAVQLALVRNPELRAAYAELGVAAADVYEAGRLSNPRLSGSRLDSDEAGALDQVTFGLSQSLASLLTLGDRSELAAASLDRAQAEAAATVYDTALASAEAWYHLATAREQGKVHDLVADAADAAAELGERFYRAGNINRLELAELRAEAAEARMAAIDARAELDAARARLGNLMGLDVAVEWRIEPGLPSPDRAAPDGAALKQLAADNRLDLLAARRAVDVRERALAITRRWRWLGDPELELETERETDGSRLTGAGLSIELPLFNQHADDLARGEAGLDAAYARRAAIANRVSHELALAVARLEAAGDQLAAFEEGLLPEHRRRVAETQYKVNYMLTGVFDLVETRVAEYLSTGEYLEAVRDHWLARLALDRATGRLSAPPDGEQRITAASLLEESVSDHAMPGMEHDTGGDDVSPEADESEPAHEHHEH